MKVREAKSTILFNILAYIIVGFITLLCLLPFWLIVSGSFTSNQSIILDGYRLFPQEFSLDAYKAIFKIPKGVIDAYSVTIFVTVAGTLSGLLLISMGGYVLQRKDFRSRNKFSFFVYFTTLFQGGLIPWYILLTNFLHLRDKIAVLILPSIMSPFLIILMKNFIKMSVPDEIIESAKIDGANDFRIYYSIVLNLSLPGLATIGLFLGLHYWNDWFMSMLFIDTPSKYSLQFFLYNLLNGAEFLRNLSQGAGVYDSVAIPTETTKLAMAVVAVGPIIFLYPFIQKYFVKGLTIGAVKG
ncbi:carbohydrate ABC transporter permease [Ruminiclostridium cellobioparum]|jgi:putative aldouronate transport system permease protein|uniref:ABC-type sugar transport system, permease component n=1 Tax=Ruminiclostridium cellobioparum subsp. termitidis CT1112 TaxID=1195236 RepID=S0FM30_RUMCE|nr:carbohydrate ABC transporter permease [Ruminiclostridium cellobioparum]EMS72967.1 ABC-type sugar transport system, permease component [Ruminiclostridium cellobioparum subsp. termitidis CT1112]